MALPVSLTNIFIFISVYLLSKVIGLFAHLCVTSISSSSICIDSVLCRLTKRMLLLYSCWYNVEKLNERKNNIGPALQAIY